MKREKKEGCFGVDVRFAHFFFTQREGRVFTEVHRGLTLVKRVKKEGCFRVDVRFAHFFTQR